MASIIPLLSLIAAIFLFAFVAARLSSSRFRLLRYWSEHPWRIFWSCPLLGIIGMLLVEFGATLPGWFLVICWFPISWISLIRGLQVWYSKRRGDATGTRA